MYMNDDDIELISRLKANIDDDDAWDGIVELYYNSLILFCGRFFTSQEEVEDIAHESLIKAKNKISQFNTNDYSSLRPWLWQVAKHTAYDKIKFYKRRNMYNGMIIPSKFATTHSIFKLRDNKPGPRTEAQKQDRFRVLYNALDKLDTRFSDVIFLHYIDNFTRKEIAEFLEISDNTVKSRLRVALEKIKKLLPDELFD